MAGEGMTDAEARTPEMTAPTERAIVIDIDEYEDALRDPKVKGFLAKAVAYGEQLTAEGRNHGHGTAKEGDLTIIDAVGFED